MERPFYIVFKDDFSSFREMYLLNCKNQVKEKLGFFLEVTKMQAQVTITELCIDGDKEFDNNKVHQIMQNFGLTHSWTVTYNHQQNIVAESENRMLEEMAHSCLESKDILKFL